MLSSASQFKDLLKFFKFFVCRRLSNRLCNSKNVMQARMIYYAKAPLIVISICNKNFSQRCEELFTPAGNYAQVNTKHRFIPY